MIYYRIAVQTKHAPTWRWMTTKLTSLYAVLNYLQTYRCPAYAQLRIFFAASVEALEEMLAAENQGDASFSVTPEYLLSGGQPQALAKGAASRRLPWRPGHAALYLRHDGLPQGRAADPAGCSQ
jgi:hypothetical protein